MYKNLLATFFIITSSVFGAGTGRSMLSGNMTYGVLGYTKNSDKYLIEADETLKRQTGLKKHMDYNAMALECLLDYSKSHNLYTLNSDGDKFYVLENNHDVDTLVCKTDRGDLLIDWSQWRTTQIDGHDIVPYAKATNNDTPIEILVDFRIKFYEKK